MSEDKRVAARVSATLRAEIMGFVLTTTNVSTTGMQLSCPTMIYGFLADELDSSELGITLNLTEDQVVRFTCEVAYVSEWSDEYLLGVRIKEFEGDGNRLLEDYIRSLSGAAANPSTNDVHRST